MRDARDSLLGRGAAGRRHRHVADLRRRGVRRRARRPLEEVLELFVARGGRVVDSSPMYGRSEGVVGEIARNLGADRLALPRDQGLDHGEAGRRRADGALHARAAAPAASTSSRSTTWWTRRRTCRRSPPGRREGADPLRRDHALLGRGLRRGRAAPAVGEARLPPDQLLAPRAARRDSALLPLAAERGVAVIANRPFGGGEALRRAAGRPLPAWAGEIGCASWAQFFLKWILGHPAVTCVIPGTGKVRHLEDNLAAAAGALPDAEQRRRMAEAAAASSSHGEAPLREGSSARLPVRRRRVAPGGPLGSSTSSALMSSYYVLRPVRDEMGVRAGVSRMPVALHGHLRRDGARGAGVRVGGLALPAAALSCRRMNALLRGESRRRSRAALGDPGAARWAGSGPLRLGLRRQRLRRVGVLEPLLGHLPPRGGAPTLRDRGRRRERRSARRAGRHVAPRTPRRRGPAAPAAGRPLLACAVLSRRLARCAPAAVSAEEAEPPEKPIGGGALSGLARIARSPFLLALVVALVCYTLISTVLYFSQTEIVGAAVRDSRARDGPLRGDGFRRQRAHDRSPAPRHGAARAAGRRRGSSRGRGGARDGRCRRPRRRAGARRSSWPCRSSTAPATSRSAGPAREALFVPLDAEARYKAKSFIDTAVFRAADSASAWGIAALRAGGAGLSRVAWLSVPIGIVWTRPASRIGRKWERRPDLAASRRCDRCLDERRGRAGTERGMSASLATCASAPGCSVVRRSLAVRSR